MIPFSAQTAAYKAKMKVLKTTAKILPFPKPTLFSGPGSSLELCEAIAQVGTSRLLIVTDAMLVEIGLLADIQQRLTELGVDFIVYDGVKPDPTVAQIEAGLTMLQDNDCEAILAFGGGSSIDAAKVIAARATNNKPVRKMEGLFRIFHAPMPLYAIPTTAGTGSEVTVAAVVSDPERQSKSAIMDPKLVPAMAALDGSLMTGLPPAITAATGMDALTHAVEAYLSVNALPDTDSYALAATRLIMEYLPVVMEDGQNIKARQHMAMASYYAALAFTRAGVGYVHAIAHNFGAYYHTPHGMANAIVMPYVLDYSKPACTSRLAKLGDASGLRQDGDTDAVLADRFIAHIRSLNARFGIPEKLDALRAEDIPAITRAALKEAHSTYAVPRYMDRPTCESLIRQIM
ncbi:MAG: iron-containing alcohol dehydrogenase [Gammaproteobacteria bacterium]|nr:iron-containing alcohol dehydrogenase [Gammaproteobacteria bacterium]